MYLKTQMKYGRFLEDLLKILSEQDFDKNQFVALKEEIGNQDLLIPIIGSFSAGKSSLINGYLGNNYLPVGIAPETELATEIRYDTNEHLLATLLDGSTETFEINQFDIIKKRAKEFSHLKLFLNNEKLRQIQPLVLVDMPGFGSSLENHNKAINYYLPRGVFFIVVVSIEEGNITRSMMRQLSELDNINRDFIAVISKTNLRSPEQVEELKNYIAEQLDLAFVHTHEVTTVSNQPDVEMDNAIQKINPEKIFENLFLGSIKNSIKDLNDNITVKQNALKNDSSLNEDTIKELTATIAKVEQKRDSLVRNVRIQYSNNITNNCIDYIGRQLSESVDELASYLNSNNTDRFNSAVLEIVRDSFSHKLQSEFKQVSHQIIGEFNIELNSLNDSMQNFGMNTNWSNDLTNRLQKSFELTGTVVGKLANHFTAKENAGKIFKLTTTILAVTTGVLAPVVELAIIFLPEIIGFFTKNSQEKQVRDKVQNEIIPKIKSELRKKLPEIINEQVENMIQEISVSFEGELNEKKVLIDNLQKERQDKLQDIQAEVNKLQGVKTQITQLSATL